MAAVHAVEIADGQGAGRSHARMPEPPENLHRWYLFDSASRPSNGPTRGFLSQSRYIVTQCVARKLFDVRDVLVFPWFFPFVRRRV
jgi:hypothetical protein